MAEIGLWRAVLELAIHDAIADVNTFVKLPERLHDESRKKQLIYSFQELTSRKREKISSIRFFSQDTQDFKDLCSLAEVQSHRVRDGVIKILQENNLANRQIEKITSAIEQIEDELKLFS